MHGVFKFVILLLFQNQNFTHFSTGYEFDYVFDWTVLKYKQGQKQKVQLISFCASFFFGVMGLMVTIVYTSIRLQLQSCACAVVYSYSMWLTLLVAICLLELNVLCKILKQSLNHLLELIKLQLSLVTVAPYICLW